MMVSIDAMLAKGDVKVPGCVEVRGKEKKEGHVERRNSFEEQRRWEDSRVLGSCGGDYRDIT